MNPLRRWKREIATVVVTVICMLPIGLAYTAISVKHAQRRSDVISCQAYDRMASGIGKLVDQLKATTATSKQRSSIEKSAVESFYTLLLGDFPKLDCTANPIDFVGAP